MKQFFVVFKNFLATFFVYLLFALCFSTYDVAATDKPLKGEQKEIVGAPHGKSILETADEDCNAVPGPRCTGSEYTDRVACEWFGIHPPRPCFTIIDCAQYYEPPKTKEVERKGEDR